MSGETKTPVLRFPDSAPWEVHPLGELANLYQPQTIGGSLFTKTGYTVYGANGPIGFYSRFNHEESQIIISCRGTCGTVNKTAPRSWINGNAMVVAPKPGKKLDKDFLLNVLKQTDFTPCILGSSQPQITRGPLSEVGIALAPTITEQQSIGGFFRELDALIAEREKALGKLESLKKAMLEKMFPQGDAKVPEVRFKGFEGEWEEKKLGTAFGFGVQNNTLSRSELSFAGTVRNIHYGDVLIKFGSVLDVSKDTVPFVADKSFKCTGKNRLADGDIVMADTAEDEAVGKVTEIRGTENAPAVSGLHTIVLRPLCKYAEGFLGYSLNAPAFHERLVSLMQGIKVLSINKGTLAETVFLAPAKSAEQQEIGSFFRSLDALLAARREEAEKLKQLKKAFLERMFA